MKTLRASRQFQKDFKLSERRGKDMHKLQAVLDLLAGGEELPARLRDHKLSGEYAGTRECHIEPDWLLVYEVNGDTIGLARLGTHSDLF